MIYIIDANNVAGKLGILKNPDFDLELIELVKKFADNRKSNIYLVFDSNDPYGDKDVNDNFIVVRAPRNEVMNSADEKIIELACKEMASGKNEICVVTSDNEIINILSDDKNLDQNKLKFLKSEEFVIKIQQKITPEEPKEDIEDNKKDAITNELLDIWLKQ